MPGAHLLIVDDEDDIREVAVMALELDPGFEVRDCGSGAAAIEAAAAWRPGLILLDVMMPGMDGLAVLRKIREAGHRIPVLMLTARGDEADRVVGLELGADDYIAKPFSPRELLARLRAVLRRAQPDTVAENM